MLIEEYSKKPILYDYRLPIETRGRTSIADAWKEIADNLHCNITCQFSTFQRTLNYMLKINVLNSTFMVQLNQKKSKGR